MPVALEYSYIEKRCFINLVTIVASTMVMGEVSQVWLQMVGLQIKINIDMWCDTILSVPT